jgi:hypothetical protein
VSRSLFCFVVFLFVLLCFVSISFVLFCFVLFCFVLFCFVLFCFVLLAVTMGCSNGHTSIGLCCVMEMRGKERRGHSQFQTVQQYRHFTS